MLQFNLPKTDRVALRKGIATGKISPAQLNVMSSTDLADEHTKHEIEVAEKEALAHSILQKITAPLAKMTHKGYETIEDVSGTRSNAEAVREEEERRMEMEKQQRERRARLRELAQENPNLGLESQFSPVEPSPVSAGLATSPTGENSQQGWGALSSISPFSSRVSISTRPAVRPIFIPSAVTEPTSEEGGLSLGDLINIDDDKSTSETPQTDPQQRMNERMSVEPVAKQSPVVSTPSGPSPFAVSRPAESPARAVFDLNALWGQGDASKPKEGESDDVTSEHEDNMDQGSDDMDVESTGNVEDHELDAILQQDTNALPSSDDANPLTSGQPDIVEIANLPTVWTGKVSVSYFYNKVKVSLLIFVIGVYANGWS